MIKSKAKTVVIDKGMDRFLTELELIKGGSFVKVGVQSDAPKPAGDGNINMAQLASVHEFGTNRAGRGGAVTIPERSFIRSTMDEKNRIFEIFVQKQLSAIGRGSTTVKRALGAVGLFIAAAIQRKMTQLQDPPNAPSTIAKKGSSNPLIDTGRLRASIRHKTVLKKATVRGPIKR